MTLKAKQFLAIVLGTIGLACLLGVCLDLVTANVAVEYFSVHHPRIVETENPWILAIVWGIGASWWFGAIAGVILGVINDQRQEPLQSTLILKWNAIACAVLWLLMMTILITFYAITNLVPEVNRSATFEFDRRLISVAVTHQTEYVLGAIALVIVAIKTWRKK